MSEQNLTTLRIASEAHGQRLDIHGDRIKAVEEISTEQGKAIVALQTTLSSLVRVAWFAVTLLAGILVKLLMT